MSVVIIGIDPGSSCGLAVFEGPHRSFLWQGPRAELGTLLVGYVPRVVDVARYRGHRVVIVVERYVQLGGRRGRTPQSDALEVIGEVESVGRQLGVDVVLQSVNDAKALANDELLRKTGLYASGRNVNRPDANDANMATRHALLYMAKKHNTVFARLVSGV